MQKAKTFQTPAKQSGVVLLIFVLVILMSFGTYILSGLSINQLKIEQKKQTLLLLRDAKAAIIAHAVTHMDQANGEGEMGYLPCPNKNASPEGGSVGNCDVAKKNSFGYYPWASLETDVLTDNSGSCLRYVVSGSYKNSPHSGMINEDTNGQLQVVDDAGAVIIGSAAEDRLVAIILAPGDPLAEQQRTMDVDFFCGNDYENMTAYLEGNGVTDNGTLSGVADGIDQFIHATADSVIADPPYNDQFVTVTKEDIWGAIVNRPDFLEKMNNLTEGLAVCLVKYAAINPVARLPWVAPMNLADYRVDDSYDDTDGTTSYAGRTPFKIDNSNTMIGLPGSDDLFDVADCNSLILIISKSYLVNNAGNYALGDTEIFIDSGARLIFVGDTVEFSGDTNQYTVSESLNDGLIVIDAPGLQQPLNNNVPLTITRNIDLKTGVSEYRKLWDNWKDHFFYVLSEDYELDDLAVTVVSIVNAKNLISDVFTNTTTASEQLALGHDADAQAAANNARIAANKAIDAVDEAIISATAAVVVAAALEVAATTPEEIEVAASEVADAAAMMVAVDAAELAATAGEVAAQDAQTAALALDQVALDAALTDVTAARNDAVISLTNAESAAEPKCLPVNDPINCIKVDAPPLPAATPTERAGMVIFSGSAQNGLLRTGPVGIDGTGVVIDVNTKHQISNYIENNNAGIFPDNMGNGAYETVNGTSNDIMFCIQTDIAMSVVECL